MAFFVAASLPAPALGEHLQRPLQAEIQQIRQELDRREKDINELMVDSDLMDMEEELRRLRKHVTAEHQKYHQLGGAGSTGTPPPRDYTDKSISVAEFGTLKLKLERSELALAEKQRELQNLDLK